MKTGKMEKRQNTVWLILQCSLSCLLFHLSVIIISTVVAWSYKKGLHLILAVYAKAYEK